MNYGGSVEKSHALQYIHCPRIQNNISLCKSEENLINGSFTRNKMILLNFVKDNEKEEVN